MIDQDSIITLVIHSSSRAFRLKEVLESHGIGVILEDVQQDSLPDNNLKKVRISVSDLVSAVKILESGDLVSAALSFPKISDSSNTLLIPVDFSKASINSVKVGFYLAKLFDVEPVILHSFIAPPFVSSDIYENMVDPSEYPEFADMEQQIDISKFASAQLSKFKKTVDKACAEGVVPKVKFSTMLMEGIPEQVIQEYCRQNKPLMIVMATRGKDQKESDLVGSVTAEVIDSCRVPILTVPDNYSPRGVDRIKNILIFCNFANFELITIRGLMRMFNYPACNIWLVPANDSSSNKNVRIKLDKLKTYLTEVYPTANFCDGFLEKDYFDSNVRRIIEDNNIDMIIVPNKKSNAISRFFRPTLAHKILFERDLPLLVIPV